MPLRIVYIYLSDKRGFHYDGAVTTLTSLQAIQLGLFFRPAAGIDINSPGLLTFGRR